MAIAIDASVLIAAANKGDPRNDAARAALVLAARNDEPIYLFWPVVLAYLRVTTHPTLFAQPFEFGEAWANVETSQRWSMSACLRSCPGSWISWRS